MSVRTKIKRLRLALGAMAVVVFPGSSLPAQVEAMIHWQSENRTPTELSSELNAFYGGLVELLEQGQRVTTEMFEDVDGQQVVQIAKSKELYLGDHFPTNLNAYLCLLNPELCEPVQSVSGQVTYKWHNKLGDTIELPVVKFEKVVVPKPYWKKENDTIRRIVVDDRGGCESLDARCERYLQGLNRTRDGFMKPGYEGQILVPTATYRADVELERVGPISTEGFLLPPLPGSTESDAWLDQFQQKQIPAGRLILNNADAPSTGPTGERAKIRSLVNFPTSLQVNGNATIAVFDRQVFIDHCDFHGRIKFIPVSETGSAVIYQHEDTVKTGGNGSPPAACNSPLNGGAKKGRDHGTHVVGIIAGRTLGLDDEQNVLRRFVYAFQIPDRQQTPDTEIIPSLFTTINESIKDTLPNVMNMSISYDFEPSDREGFDLIAQLIRDLGDSDILFVAAAGNAPEGRPGEQFQGSCDVRPACVEADNVISVVALDLNQDGPSLLPASNRGTIFDIAAPGADIESTTFSHTKGVMTGTSQAVPLVSIAASLLMSMETMLAWQVRHRLMYTATLFPQLEQDVFSGRLDIAAALDLESAKIVHNMPSLPETLSGQLLTGNHRKIEFQDFDDGNKTFLVHPRDIRRLQSYPDVDYALLYYVDEGTGRELKRQRVFLKDNQGKLQLRVEAPNSLMNRVKVIPVASIVNYVAAF